MFRAVILTIFLALPVWGQGRRAKPVVIPPPAPVQPAAPAEAPGRELVPGPVAQVRWDPTRVYVVRVKPALGCLLVLPAAYRNVICANPDFYFAAGVPVEAGKPNPSTDERILHVKPVKISSPIGVETSLSVILMDGRRVHVLLKNTDLEAESVYEVSFLDPTAEAEEQRRRADEETERRNTEQATRKQEAFLVKASKITARFGTLAETTIKSGDATIKLVAEDIEGRTAAALMIDSPKKAVGVSTPVWKGDGIVQTVKKTMTLPASATKGTSVETAVFSGTVQFLEVELTVGRKPVRLKCKVVRLADLPLTTAHRPEDVPVPRAECVDPDLTALDMPQAPTPLKPSGRKGKRTPPRTETAAVTPKSTPPPDESRKETVRLALHRPPASALFQARVVSVQTDQAKTVVWVEFTNASAEIATVSRVEGWRVRSGGVGTAKISVTAKFESPSAFVAPGQMIPLRIEIDSVTPWPIKISFETGVVKQFLELQKP